MYRIRLQTLPLLALLLATPAVLNAEPAEQEAPGFWDTAKEKSAQTWEATREGTGKAVDWTVEKSTQGWGKTKEIASHSAQWTREKSAQAWAATKTGASRSAKWVQDKTGSESESDVTAESAETSP